MITFDERRASAHILGQRISLTETEFLLLKTLVDGEGYATHEELLTAWAGIDISHLDVSRDVKSMRPHLSNLRRKLPEGCAIVNQHKRGYVLDVPGMPVLVPRVEKVFPCRACGTTERRKHCPKHREELFLCGHPKEGNTTMGTANGYYYARCRLCQNANNRRRVKERRHELAALQGPATWAQERRPSYERWAK